MKVNTDKYRVRKPSAREQEKRIKELRAEYARKTVKDLMEYRRKMEALRALDRR